MNGHERSWEQVKQQPYVGRPHVVILGAGASLAAFPNGDAGGAVLPLMNNLADVLGLTDEIERSGLACRDRNFEDVYSEIASIQDLAGLQCEVEDRVSDYFARLRLPESPTLYDYLVLSLREKDYIATFNWDPFLYRACWRNHGVAPMPKTLYLHGCAITGYCLKDRKVGLFGTQCSVCKKPFTPTRLVYPVANKDYISDKFISAEWKSVSFALKHAYVLTIFGYSAPASDAAAIELLSSAWGGPRDKSLEETEIIDIKPEEELATTWSPFIHTHHYRTSDSYFSSLLGTFPRRTCEAIWSETMDCYFLEYKPVPKFESITQLQEFARDIRSHEM